MSSAQKSYKKPYYEQVADKLIEQLKKGTAPFQKPWEPGNLAMPHNPVSGARYKGSNAFWLQMQEREDPRWMTYKQAQSIGAQVRKGEKGTLIQYWKFTEEKIKRDANGKPVIGADGKKVKQTTKLDKPRAFSASVFNAEQIDGLPELKKVEPRWDRHERAEKILAASAANISHDQEDRAFYSPSTDKIHLPTKEQFPTADNYYAVALHELGHWTGHPSRLDRDLTGSFGSEKYAKEELRAEISSLMVGDELGIGHDPSNHAAYVNSWVKVLQDDPKEILRAARDAEAIKDYILSSEQKKTATVQASAKKETPASSVDEAAQRLAGSFKNPADAERFIAAVNKNVAQRVQHHYHDQEEELER
ncbi:zincin-like metallopeptidase domain-containing protein [Thiolapillus sp.]|uniref:zincin-like metallopeptidase domain-containing protein n=1 Tax=Thiolapillus sp. TaxID=2017437 RepID=UPI003AF713C6